MMKRWFLCGSLWLLTACTVQSPQTAASHLTGQATANPALIATAQADQYWRDAQATTTAQAATIQANYQHIVHTAEAATSTTAAQQSQATATAHVQQTADALTFSLTAEAATMQASTTRAAATAQAQATITAQARQDTQATSTADALATTTAFQSTRQAFEMEQVQATARREQAITAAITILLGITAVFALGLFVIFIWRIIPTLVSRVGIVRYGQHGNPLLLLGKDGRTVLTDPLRMLQAAVTVDENGQVTMPELTPNQLQTLVTGGALQTLVEQIRHAPGHRPILPAETMSKRRVGPVEMEKMVRHAAPPMPKRSPSNSSTGVEGEGPETAAFMPDLLTQLDQEQAILIYGAKNTGKTTLLKHIMARRPNCLILDPHGAPGKWPHCLMIGAGRDYDAISMALAGLIGLMNHRYREIGHGQVQEGTHEKVTLLIDEYRSIVQNVSKSGKAITALLTEARKAQIDMVLVSHSRLVKALGMKGESDLREGFAVVHLQEAYGRRTATLDVGQGEAAVQLPGPFVQQGDEGKRPCGPAWLLQAVNQVQASSEDHQEPLFIAPVPAEPEPSPAQTDAALLLAQSPDQFTSRRKVATFLTNGLDNRYAYERADEALAYLAEQGHEWAKDLLGG